MTRIYNVLVLFIEGEKSKSEFFKVTNSLNISFLNFVLISFVNWTAMVYNWRLTYVLSPSSGSRGEPGNAPPPNTKFVEMREWESIVRKI